MPPKRRAAHPSSTPTTRPHVMDSCLSLESLQHDREYSECNASLKVLDSEESLRRERTFRILNEHRISSLEASIQDSYSQADALVTQVEHLESQSEQLRDIANRNHNAAQSRGKAISVLQQKVESLLSTETDRARTLSDKHALERELASSNLEIEHLRATVTSQQAAARDKHDLQRQLTLLEDELTNERKTIQRLKARGEKASEEDATRDQLVADLRTELKALKRERDRDLKDARMSFDGRIQEMERELAREKRAREATERRMEDEENHRDQMDVLRATMKKLEASLREEQEKRKRAEDQLEENVANNSNSAELQETREEIASLKTALADEKTARAEDRKEVKRLLQGQNEEQRRKRELDVEKEALEEKLDKFREKLRETKEKLKETEGELRREKDRSLQSTTSAGVSKAGSVARATSTKAGRKRKAAEVHLAEPDMAIGTPGNGQLGAKRSKRASSVVGEKSTFSITPFLNRTASVAPEAPSDADQPVPSIENEAASETSPSAGRQLHASVPPTKTGRKALASTSGNKIAAETKRRPKVAPRQTLEAVAEESTQADNLDGSENQQPATETVAVSSKLVSAVQAPRPALKPKALNSFASFREGSLAPLPAKAGQQKKQKKLLGLGSTLFDEEEDEADGGGLGRLSGGQRAFGTFANASGRGPGGLPSLVSGKRKLLGQPKIAEGDFVFSPLKRDRKAIMA